MAIIIAAGSFFIIEGKKFIDTHNFKTTMKFLNKEVEQARVQSLLYHTEVGLEILCNGPTYSLKRVCKEPIFALSKEVALPGIREMKCQGKEMQKLLFMTFSSGYCIQSEKFELSCNKTKQEFDRL